MWLHLGGCTEGDPVGPPGGGKARSEGWEQPWDTLSCGFRLAASPGPSPRCWHSRLLSYQTTHTPWQTGRASRTGAGIWCHLTGLLLRASELLCRLSSLQLALPVPAEPLPAEDAASLLFGPEAVLPARRGGSGRQARAPGVRDPGAGGSGQDPSSVAAGSSSGSHPRPLQTGDKTPVGILRVVYALGVPLLLGHGASCARRSGEGEVR